MRQRLVTEHDLAGPVLHVAGDGISEDQLRKVESYVELGKVEAKLLVGGAGYKQSGIGREWGPEGLDAFLETKAIMINLF